MLDVHSAFTLLKAFCQKCHKTRQTWHSDLECQRGISYPGNSPNRCTLLPSDWFHITQPTKWYWYHSCWQTGSILSWAPWQGSLFPLTSFRKYRSHSREPTGVDWYLRYEALWEITFRESENQRIKNFQHTARYVKDQLLLKSHLNLFIDGYRGSNECSSTHKRMAVLFNGTT